MPDLFTQPTYRILVAIDSQNLYHAAKHEYGQEAKVDYRKLKDLILQQAIQYSKKPDIEAIVYAVARNTYDSNDTFIVMLESIGFATRTQCVPYSPKSQKNAERFEWSIGITIDAIKRALSENPIRNFMLVTGSGMFQPLVVELQNMNIPTDVYSFRQSLSTGLSQVSSHTFILDRSVIWDRSEYCTRKPEDEQCSDESQ